jgi:hypothetical protein
MSQRSNPPMPAAMLANPALRFHQAFSATGGIDPMHAAFDPLRTFLAGL